MRATDQLTIRPAERKAPCSTPRRAGISLAARNAGFRHPFRDSVTRRQESKVPSGPGKLLRDTAPISRSATRLLHPSSLASVI